MSQLERITTFLGANIAPALGLAIRHQREYERKLNFVRDSMMVENWVMMLEALKTDDVTVRRLD